MNSELHRSPDPIRCVSLTSSSQSNQIKVIMHQCLWAYGWNIWLLQLHWISLHLSLLLLWRNPMVDRSHEHQRFLLACTRALACRARILVEQFLQCTQFWTGYKVHTSDVHPKLVYRYWWQDWWLVHEHNTSQFLGNPFVDRKMYLLLPSMKPSYIFRMCILFLDNIGRSVCMQRFLSDNRHTETYGSTSLDRGMVCGHCILGSNNQVRSSFWLWYCHYCPRLPVWWHGGLQLSVWCSEYRLLPPGGAAKRPLSFHKLFFPEVGWQQHLSIVTHAHT